MEGPSLIIACEELAPFLNRKITAVEGTSPLAVPELVGRKLTRLRSWGKHLLLGIGKETYRIHFLMFGSYRFEARPDKAPKLALHFGKRAVRFYTCAVGRLSPEQLAAYDWRTDVMSESWSPRRAARAIAERPQAMVCDILMDQTLFAGVGNIIKNEVLFRLGWHPERTVATLSPLEIRSLVKEARRYCFDFYDWKKAFVLKRNWQVFRKRRCPVCESAVVKRPTGRLQRLSHFCPRCQAMKKKKRGADQSPQRLAG